MANNQSVEAIKVCKQGRQADTSTDAHTQGRIRVHTTERHEKEDRAASRLRGRKSEQQRGGEPGQTTHHDCEAGHCEYPEAKRYRQYKLSGRAGNQSELHGGPSRITTVRQEFVITTRGNGQGRKRGKKRGRAEREGGGGRTRRGETGRGRKRGKKRRGRAGGEGGHFRKRPHSARSHTARDP